MVLRLVHLWNTAAGVQLTLLRNAKQAANTLAGTEDEDLENEDPEIPNPVRERRKEQRREQEAALDRDRHERRAKERESEEADDSSLMLSWLASDEYRHSFEQLSNDIADARIATVHAYDRALRNQQRAEDALQDARNRAIILPDGRRAYFTQDGSRLYGENDQQITDSATIARAQGLHAQKSNASTYEEYVQKRDTMQRATENTQHLAQNLTTLDEIESRIKAGNLSRDDLAQARKQTDAVIASLPPDAREEYEQRKAVRERPDDNYRSAASLYTADAAFPAAPTVARQFGNAAALEQQQAPSSNAGQKPALESTDDYKPGF